MPLRMPDKEKSVEDFIHFQEKVEVTRYKGSINIKEMMEKGSYIEAFTHCQLAIEKILLDKLVLHNKKLSRLTTFQLIQQSYKDQVIDEKDYNDLLAFNNARNKIVHEHGKWWDASEYKQSLERGLKFLEKNGM